MSPIEMKRIGIGCFVVSAILLFVAWERYQSNANQVRFMNSMMQSTGFDSMTDGPVLRPGMPAATTYSLLFAVLFGIGGVACFVFNEKKNPRSRQNIRSRILPDQVPAAPEEPTARE